MDGVDFVAVELLGCVVATLDVDIRPGQFEKADRAGFGEDGDSGDDRESGKQFGPVILWIERAGRTFEGFDRGIAVDADNQHIAEPGGGLEIAEMTDVEDVETSVGGDHAATVLVLFFAPSGDVVEGKNLAHTGGVNYLARRGAGQHYHRVNFL